MSVTTPQQSSLGPFAARGLVLAGLLVAALAWLLPVNLKSLSPELLRMAGRGTPTLGAYGRDLVNLEKIGPAALVKAVAVATDDPRASALAAALADVAARQRGLVAWGGCDQLAGRRRRAP